MRGLFDLIFYLVLLGWIGVLLWGLHALGNSFNS